MSKTKQTYTIYQEAAPAAAPAAAALDAKAPPAVEVLLSLAVDPIKQNRVFSFLPLWELMWTFFVVFSAF